MRDVVRSREPEVELLLRSVAKAAGVTGVPDFGRAAEEVTDWAWFRTLTEGHEVAPLVASSLRGDGEDLVPSEVVDWLWEERRRVARRNLYLASELRSLLDSLESRGIECRVLKGLPLGTQALGDAGLRPTADLDILVRRTDLESATQVFIEHAFYREEPLPPAAQKAKEEDLYSRAFGRREGWVGLDVHWAFAPRKYGESRLMERVWAERDEVSLFDQTFPVLSWPHLPVHLAIHGSKHGPFPWPKLKWIADIAGLLVRRSRQEWRDAVSIADDLGCRRRLLLGVAMAQRCLVARLTPELQEALTDESAVLVVSAELESYLFSRRRAAPSALGRVRIDTALRDGPTEKVAMAARSVLRPSKKDWGKVVLPEGFTWLYGPLRAVRLIWRYGLHPWRIRKLFRSRTLRDPD